MENLLNHLFLCSRLVVHSVPCTVLFWFKLLAVEYFIYLAAYNILSNLQLYWLYLMGLSVECRGEITRATNLHPKNIKNTDPFYERQWKSDIIQTENSILIYTNFIFILTCSSLSVTHHVTSILLCVAFCFITLCGTTHSWLPVHPHF